MVKIRELIHRRQYAIIEQILRFFDIINTTIQQKFLDVGQDFDNVLHRRLLYKLKKNLPQIIYVSILP